MVRSEVLSAEGAKDRPLSAAGESCIHSESNTTEKGEKKNAYKRHNPVCLDRFERRSVEHRRRNERCPNHVSDIKRRLPSPLGTGSPYGNRRRNSGGPLRRNESTGALAAVLRSRHRNHRPYQQK